MDKQARLAAVGAIAGRTKDIARAVTNIKRGMTALDKLVHDTGLAIIISSMPQDEGGHLDHGKSLAFVQAISPGHSRNRIVAWLHEFSNIRVSSIKNKDGTITFKTRLLKMNDPEYKTARPIEADNMPFWKLNAEREVVVAVFDDAAFDQALQRLLKRYDDAKAAGKAQLMPATETGALASLRKTAEVVHRRVEALKAKPASDIKPSKKVAVVTDAKAVKANARRAQEHRQQVAATA